MAIGPRNETKGWQISTIVFVSLFLIATAVAILYIYKAEESSQRATDLQNQMDELATNAQWQNRGSLIGSKKSNETYIGKINEYLNQAVGLILGSPVEQTSAEVKIDNSLTGVRDVFSAVSQNYPNLSADPNTTGLVRMVEKLKNQIDNATQLQMDLSQQLDDLQKRFDQTQAENAEKEQMLLAEKEEYKQQVDNIKSDYEDLKALTEQSTKEQVQTLIEQLEKERTNRRNIHQDLLKTEAELTIAQNKLLQTQQKLEGIVPPPDIEIQAFQPDGQIILIDDQAGIVHINLGSDDQVYRGLTFSVYDKNAPIPKDGKGKAEIEVFNVGNKISAARIIKSTVNQPVLMDDIVANLIWDSDQKNIFVVTGDFDLDEDGQADYKGDEKIKALIEKWGGVVTDRITVDTDFVILGEPPSPMQKPTFEQMEIDPLAMDKYEKSLQALDNYKQIQSQANQFGVPVFNTDRFLYFTGYKTQSLRAGAF